VFLLSSTWDNAASLVIGSETIDKDGFPIITEEKIEIFVNEKSVTRTEFYSAMQSGIKPSVVFEVHTEDFELSRRTIGSKPVYAEKIEYKGFVYDVIRTYSKDNFIIELTCG